MITRDIKALVNIICEYDGKSYSIPSGHLATLPQPFADKLIAEDKAVCVKNPMPSQSYQDSVMASLEKK